MEKTTATVLSNEKLTGEICDLRVELPRGWNVRPGQFAGLYPRDGAYLLMRPISLCGWETSSQAACILRLVFRAGGAGTRDLAALKSGDSLDVLGPLGNGYDTGRLAALGHVLLFGGGIGIPPLLGLAEELLAKGTEVTAVLGYRGRPLFLAEEFAAAGARVLVATEDGSAGTKGNVLDALREETMKQAAGSPSGPDMPAAVCACGPLPMLRAVKKYAAEESLLCFLSLEERMACGVGACLGCVVRTRDEDAHSHVRNARVCTEGPVFAAEEVEI